MGSKTEVTVDGILWAKLPNGLWYPTNLKATNVNDLTETRKGDLFIEDVRFCGPATIIFWGDGAKTVVKCTKGDEFNPELGMAMCLLKRMLSEEDYKTFKKACKHFIKKDEARKKGKAKFEDDMMNWSNHQETEFEKGIRKAINDVFNNFKKETE